MKAKSRTHYLVAWNGHIKNLIFLMDGENIDQIKKIVDNLRVIALEASTRQDLPLSDPDIEAGIEKGWYPKDDLINVDVLVGMHTEGVLNQ